MLKENAEAGQRSIGLGPIGYMPEDPTAQKDALSELDLEPIGGAAFRPSHDRGVGRGRGPAPSSPISVVGQRGPLQVR